MAEITDPKVLELFSAPAAKGEITDPAILSLFDKPGVPPSPASRPLGQKAFNALQALGAGITSGAAGLVGAPSDLYNLALRGQEALGLPKATWKAPGGREDVEQSTSRLMDWAGGPTQLYKPQSPMEKYIAAGGEGAVSMMSPNKGPLITGTIMGLAGEAAKNFAPDVAEAPLAAQLAVLLAAAYPGLKTPQIVKAFQPALKELGPEGLKRMAAKSKEAGETLGTPMILSQGADTTTSLSGVAGAVGRSPEGAKIRMLREQQLPAGTRKAAEFASEISPHQVQAQSIADKLLQTGEKVADWLPPGARENVLRVFPESAMKAGTVDWSQLRKGLGKLQPDAVADVGKKLTAVDPQAFPMLVKNSVEAAMDSTLRKTAQGRLDSSSLAKFASTLAGDKGTTKRAAFQEQMRQVAIANGKDPDAVVAATDKFLDALQVAGREQFSPETADRLFETAGATIVNSTLRAFGLIAPLRGWGGRMFRKTASKTFTEIADILTTPEGLTELLKIERYSSKAEKAKKISKAIVSVQAQSHEE